MKTIGIIQARMNSERLPKKVLLPVCGVPIIELVYQRAAKASNIDKVILATSNCEDDDVLDDFMQSKGFHLFRGSKNNVLERYYLCAEENNADILVRFTGDNPLIDPATTKEAVHTFLYHKNCDYLKYGINLPLGTQIEVFSFASLKKAYEEATDPICLEHVTPYLYKNKSIFRCLEMPHGSGNHSHLRWTVDTGSDYKLIDSIYTYCSKQFNSYFFSIPEILTAYQKNPSWLSINDTIQQIKV